MCALQHSTLPFFQFFVTPPSNGGGDDGVSIGDDSVFQTESIGGFSAGGKVTKQAAAAGAGVDGAGDEDEDEGAEEEAEADANDRFANLPRKFRVRVQPNSTLPFDFIFRPSDMSPFDFLLPLTMPGLVATGGSINEAVAAVLAGLRRPVTARGVTPRLRLLPDSQVRGRVEGVGGLRMWKGVRGWHTPSTPAL